MNASRIGLYWPADGEIDPRPLLWLAEHMGKRCYLPVLSPIRAVSARGKLWMVRYRPFERMRPNRFKIPEPLIRGSLLIPARHLDLLIVPLVGFDAQARRIGMGGGFYDRTLAYLRLRHHRRHPRLFGIAHECQRLEHIEPRPWDIALDAVFTETGVYARHPVTSTDAQGTLV